MTDRPLARHRRLFLTLLPGLVGLAGLVGFGSTAAADELSYRLTYPGSSPHRVAISLEVPDGTDARAFLMPLAIPMGYSEVP